MQVAIADIKPPRTLLRLVDKTRLEYHELRESIREHGLLKPILVRPVDDHYQIVVGNHRFSACRDLGHDTIEAIIREVRDEDVTTIQIQENAVQVETNPVEYAVALRKILKQNPDWTLKDLSGYVKKGTPWLSKILNLTYLNPDFHSTLADGKLSISNAAELARLPQQMQVNHFDNACTMPFREFRPLVSATCKQLREARREENFEAFKDIRFEAIPYLRSLNQIRQELKHQKHGAYTLALEGCKTLIEAYYAGLRWAMHLDPLSVEAQKRSALDKQEKMHQDSLQRRKHEQRLDEV